MTGTASGQAVVESGLGAARATTTTAPAKGIGKAISGLADSLDKAVAAGQQVSEAHSRAETLPKSTAKVSSSAKRPLAPANLSSPPAASWEDPSGIKPGLSYTELLRRFGPPTLEITGEAGKSLTYFGNSGAFQLDVRDEKVTSIEKAKS